MRIDLIRREAIISTTLRLAGMTIITVILLGFATGIVRADTTIVVNSTADRIANDGECTLREAVRAANEDKDSGPAEGECASGSGTDRIELPPGVYTLDRNDNGKEDAAATGDLDITGDVSIVAVGPGASVITASPNFEDRLVHVLEGQVVLQGVTLGNASSQEPGAGLYNAGVLTLRDVTIKENISAAEGGAIFNAPGATLEVVNSTITGNQSSVSGGGIYDVGSSATLSFVTMVANIAPAGAGLAGTGDALIYSNSIILGNMTQECNLRTGVSGGHNLLPAEASCPRSASDLTIDPSLLYDVVLHPLALNGGTSETHALIPGSPALELVPETACSEPVDQRGTPRPGGNACDAGAYEDPDPLIVGPIFTVNAANDQDDGRCSFEHCSLREAIQAANLRPNDAGSPDEIRFNLPDIGGATETIQVLTALPAIQDPVRIDGSSQPVGVVSISGSSAGEGSSGITVSGGPAQISGLAIREFSANAVMLTGSGGNEIRANNLSSNDGAGVYILSGDGNLILSNLIKDNGTSGIQVAAGVANTIRANEIARNSGLGIDLGPEGLTGNDAGDLDEGANDLLNTPVIFRPYILDGELLIEGRLDSTPESMFEIDFYANESCDPVGSGEGFRSIGTVDVNTDSNGDAFFTAELGAISLVGDVLTATTTNAAGSTSEFSACAIIGAGNDSWPRSYPAASGIPISQYIDRPGQSRWFHIRIEPNSKLTVTLTDLAANYDLLLYKDVGAAYQDMLRAQTETDLVELNAEFAPDVFTPDVFTPDVFTPDVFTPDVFTPDVFTPDVFTPDVFTPDVFTPDVFTPDVFTPDPRAFAAAQRSTLIGVSAFGGLTSEGIRVNTWNNSGNFYIRVRGRNGTFSLQAPFTLTATLESDLCSGLSDSFPTSSYTPQGIGYETLILTDFSRMELTAGEEDGLVQKLNDFVTRPEVGGLTLDLSKTGFEGVQAANLQADNYSECPPAKNLVALEIKKVVDRVWQQNPGLKYIVILGNDEVIPFYRYPDQAGLANEVNYVPPVRDNSSSQASLKLSYILSQDEYGSSRTLNWKNDRLPIPELSVGRLVEGAAAIHAALDAYMSTPDGVITPETSLVTGYDFLEDAANAVERELSAGVGAPATTLITPRSYSPQDDRAWTADQLRELLAAGRYDLIFLAGHFSASSALAADYSTRLLTSDIASMTAEQWANVLVFSAGCHSGYNIVNAHGVPGVTREPDWAQTFNELGATLIGGTGYQYGDTDIIEYSERLYWLFSQELRRGSGPVSIGEALTDAKKSYLSETPVLRPLHEKALLEATIFGLPMLSFDFPGARLPVSSGSNPISPDNFGENPGAALGLQYADLSVSPNLERASLDLREYDANGTPVSVEYLVGPDGFVSNTAEPALPLARIPVGAPGTVMRGVGFRGGSYSSTESLIPLVGSATTELRGTHAASLSDVFYPIVPWTVNYFQALTGTGGTTLNVYPAQFRSDGALSESGFFRTYSRMNFRLFYSSFLEQSGGNNPGLAAGPSFTSIQAAPDQDDAGVVFTLRVVGDPSAGVQQVWVLYTTVAGTGSGEWLPLDLTQDPEDSTEWTGYLDLQGNPSESLRYIVYAVNGVGMVSSDANFGHFFTPGVDPALGGVRATSLALTGAGSGAYASSSSFTATLTSDGTAMQGQPLIFSLGPQQRRALTDSNGNATVDLPIFAEPGLQEIRVTFSGDQLYAAAFAAKAFQIDKQSTSLSLDTNYAEGYPGQADLVTATLSDGTGRRLRERTVIFVIVGENGSASQAVITDYLGQAPLQALDLPTGEYNLVAYFNGTIALDDGSVLNLRDVRFDPSSSESATINLLNSPPDCSAVADSSMNIWSPDKELHPVSIQGVVDPDGHPFQITINSIYQDEPVGKGKSSPDGFGVGTSTALIRAERDGKGNGRVYEVRFTATDLYGASCQATVVAGIVSHDQGGDLSAINDGAIYDSTVPES